ncbi:MAG TPA: hypothetical protein VIV84_03555 [Burkholderiaceae bacterium]
MADTTYLTGLFADRDSAERAYQRALDRGYTQHDLDVVMSDHTRMGQFADDDDQSTHSGTRAAEGAAIGAAVGPIGTALAAVGASIAVPGLGLVIAGPSAAALSGAGGAAVGLAGALNGWQVPGERIKLYERGVAQGGILMGLRPRNEEDAIHLERQWRNADGVDIYR